MHHKVLASEKKVWKSRNDTITESAEDDIPGYRLVGDKTQTFILDVDGKVITFYYEKHGLTTYTVEYRDVDSGEIIACEKIVRDVEVGAEVTEVAVLLHGYIALAPTECTMVMQESNNVFIFWYESVGSDG